MDLVTHNNVVTAENRDSAKALWNSIKQRFTSSQSSNRARVFNNFLYLVFQEDNIKHLPNPFQISGYTALSQMTSDALGQGFYCPLCMQPSNSVQQQSKGRDKGRLRNNKCCAILKQGQMEEKLQPW
ncbi:hypothetical protein VP01_2258g1 [Puccinia sorghi]|uniref:Uncharacterized protein n=1 Tax=Puccinia sorghi TaxID=27349 RepID=A0A0L6V8J2_9BASI|nr:hypothetical protein VP01_2258g1 [Puccinia sorghi]